ncbi:probable WRKY transcription factor 65 [Rhododendron vialii]|uniref:probable WRKY transcription factor 65 n=1 Tax=Rhododendron vialii TaxID=182163 RepID=UPI00265F38B7|nr:probable WRKY transcription factor 65 [Rhododendron vialii]
MRLLRLKNCESMDGRFINNPFVNDHQEDPENYPENSGDSPLYGVFTDGKMTSTSFPKRSKRGVQKRVVSVPIKDVEGSRSKPDNSPPSDSWSWRKYGQKPIKGSPYPRGYYRCSSSKGCPARKQVERSHVDPTMLLITYSSEHNHHTPPSKKSTAMATAVSTPSEATSVEVSNSDDDKKPAVLENPKQIDPDEIYDHLGEESLLNPCEFKWFSELETTACAIIEMPSLDCGRAAASTTDGTVILSMREEDESLFSDLGELPECSVVFRRVKVEREEEERQRRCNLTPCCGTTG